MKREDGYIRYTGDESPNLVFHDGGLRPAVVAMIASAGVSILVTALWNGAAASLNPADLDWIAALLFVAALFVLRRWKLNPIWVMVGTGVVGLGLYLIIGY